MAYRSSTGNLGFFDDTPRRPERWDREKFERFSRRGGPDDDDRSSRRGPPDEHDRFRFEEHDRYPGGGRRDIEFDDHFDRRGPRVIERERFREDERFAPPRRHRTDLFEEPTPSEIASKALAPYRRKSIVERDFDPPARRPQRPQYLRRQSSLDTFDRKPYPRYGDQEREEWRPPTNVPIPLPIRERRRSPSRRRFEEFEEIRHRDAEPPREREEYREVEVRREKSTHRRSHSRKAQSVRSASSSSSSFEEVSPVREVGKKGKTRMPKRLVRKQAVIELGYPFEEEDDFIIVRRALEKEQIDEIIKVSENYKDVERTTYVYDDKTVVSAAPPPPPPPPEVFHVPPPPPSVHPSMHPSYPPPPPSMHHAPPPPPSIHASSVRSHSPSRHEFFEERVEESNHINGPLTVLVPEERRVIRSERDIKDEIRALETERRLLKYEREGDYEIIERREPKREVVRIEKDRKAKPNPKLVAAMMATLT